MIDDTESTSGQGAIPEGRPEGQQEAAERVAFCQQCGKPLTSATVRRVGAAVYCEPCLVARLEGTGSAAGATAGTAGAGWTPVSGAVPPAGGPVAGSPTPANNEPSPWLAAFLGLIPGVGAMYNGQYAKGLAHLVIFVVLQSLANNVNGVFGLLVAGWIFYQVFDAYHTAKARRDGTPLPNAFGLNDIGDRLGFGRNWPGSAARPVTSSTTAGWAAAAPVAGTAASTPPAGAAGPNWAGYVPPTNFAQGTAPPPPPVQPANYAAAEAGATSSAASPTGTSAPWNEIPYGANPYAGAYGPANPYAGAYGAGYPGAPIPPVPPVRRFPAGAAWLIALGLIFLLANLNASWRLSGEWLVTVVLAALGSWLLFRRVELVRAWAKASGDDAADVGIAPRLICQARVPIMLLVLALLFALQAAGIRTLGQTWGVLLIVFGALLIVERMVGRTTWHPMPGGVNPGVSPDPRATASGKDAR